MVRFGPVRFHLDQIHTGSPELCWVNTGAVPPWNGSYTVPNWITFKTESIWCRIGEPIQSRSARSRINARLTGTNIVPIPNDPVSCKRSLKQRLHGIGSVWNRYEIGKDKPCA